MATQADPSKILMSHTGSPKYGRSDGVGVVPDAGGDAALTDGLISVANGDIGVPLESSLWCREFIDFTGFFTPADAGATFVNQLGPWVGEAANSTSPTFARKADSVCGALEMKLSNTSEVGDLSLGWGDELNLNSSQGLILRTRLQYQTQPAAADSLIWGFGSNRADDADDTTYNAWFRVSGANDNLLVESDDNSTNDDDNDTTVDLTAGTYTEFMISMNPIHGASATDVRFYYRATLGGDWTRLLSSTTFSISANRSLQPYFQIQKTSGTTTPDILIDYIDVMWLRS